MLTVKIKKHRQQVDHLLAKIRDFSGFYELVAGHLS